MSGGSLDYAYSKINAIIEDVEDHITCWSSEEQDALDKLISLLNICSEGAKKAEWWLSQDTSSAEFLEWAKKI